MLSNKAIETVYLSEVCIDCAGLGFITVGEFDNEEIIDCICRVEEKAQKAAESREE